jgi:hypothetical protein
MLGGTWLRVRTRRRASKLTRALAAGADPIDSDELSLRAGQLRSREAREAVALSLRGAMRLANLNPVGPGYAPRINRMAVRRCREPLGELVERLEGEEILEPSGLAKAWLLVRDGGSALFEPTAASLADELGAILAALDRAADHSPHDRFGGA